MIAPPAHIIKAAANYARFSPCQKSKRGAAIYNPYNADIPIAGGCNARPFIAGPCDGSATCRRDCGKTCAHAEQRAIRAALASNRVIGMANPALAGFELVHVKVVDNQIVAGGSPSCWQCARDVADVGLDAVWLYQTMWTPTRTHDPDKWVRYTAVEFLEATLKRENLHPYVQHKIRVGSVYECSCGYQPTTEDDLAMHIATHTVAL